MIPVYGNMGKSNVTRNNNTGRTINAKRNIIYGLFQVILSQVLPFVIRTVMIYRFGVEYLGLNSLFTSVLSVLSLMELGFGTAVVYSMYKPAAEGNTDQLCAYLTYYRKIYRVIGLAILTVGLMLMPFLNRLVHDPTMPGGLNIYICYLIFLTDTVISYILYGYMTAIPAAYQRRDILSKVDMAMNILQCAVRTFLLLASRNFYLYLLSIPVCTIIRNLFIAWTIRKKYPELKCRGEIKPDQKHDLNKKVYGLVIEKITAVSRNSIDSLCITALIGLAINGIYNNYYYVMTGISAFSTMLLNSMMSGVGNTIAVESREKNYSDMRMFDFIYTAIAGWATACMLCLYQPFIKIWLGKNMMLEFPVVIGLCAYFYILKSGDIRWVYGEGRGLWYENRFIMIGEALVNTVLNILFCKIMGVLGIILATVISVFFTNYFFCPRLLFKLYFQNGKLKEYRIDHVCYGITMAMTAGFSWVICEKLFPLTMREKGIIYSVICLGGRLGICTVLAVVIFMAIWCRSGRYYRAVEWMKKMLLVRTTDRAS